jgi:hypothetical protein
MSRKACHHFLQPKKKPHNDNEPFSLWLSSAIEEKNTKDNPWRLVIIFYKYKPHGWFLFNAHTHTCRGVVLPSSSNPKVRSSGIYAKGTSL